MEQELLFKFFEVNELIKNEIKHQTGLKNKNKDKNEKNKSLSLNAKNALRILADSKEINQRTLSKKLNITAQAMSEILKKLEQAQYIERKNNKINNENIILITEKGKEKAENFSKWFEVISNKVFIDMTE